MVRLVTRADQIIPAVVAEILRKAPLCPEKVEFAWHATVGPALQRATNVRLEETGVLRVTAEDAHWGREVKRAAPLILARLENLLGPGVVKRIRVS